MRSISFLSCFCLLLGAGDGKSISNSAKAQLLAHGGAAKQNAASEEDPAVTLLREYIRINTGPPNPDYEAAIDWFRTQARDYFDLEFNLVRFDPPDLFAIWLTWRGTNPELKSILLNSHMDVVEAEKEKWAHDPFEAYKDEEGNIFGRGAIDMKSTTVGQLEAIRQLREEGFRPLRDVHVSILPDEENGGEHGMKAFANSPEFRALNVGFDFDESGEGTKSADGVLTFAVPYAQKSAWQFNVTAEGVAGHGSNIAPNGTAGQKLNYVINQLFKLKESEVEHLQTTPGATDSDVTSVNLVRLGGGIGNNVLPASLWAFFDMRIRLRPNEWNFSDYQEFLDKIAREAGEGVTYNFTQKGLFSTETSVDPEANVWWATLLDTCNKMGWKCEPWYASPTSDGGYVRNLGIPTLGFVPRLHREGLGPMHGVNEAVNEQEFLDSIERYKILFKDLMSVPAESE